MRLLRTPDARPWRIGGWVPPFFAAAVLLAFLLVLPVFSPTQGGTTSTTQTEALRQQLAQKQAALKQATAELNALQAEFDKLAEEHNAVEVRLAELEAEISEAEKDIAQSEQDLSTVRAQLEDRLISLYKDGASSSTLYLEVLFSGNDLVSVLDRFDQLTKLADQDQALFDQVKDYLETTRASKALLEEKQAEQTAEMERLVQLEDETSAKLTSSAAHYQTLKNQVAGLKREIQKADAAAAAAAAAARAAEIAAKAWKEGRVWNNSGSGTINPPPFTFPVKGPHSFINSWHYARSGGRHHTGCDVMAVEGTPLVACVTGTIVRVNPTDTNLGGIQVRVQSETGYVYYYAHLSRIASGIGVGSYVKAGQTIGYVGHTGNAGRCNHLHFAILPGGHYAVNPYATLRFYDD
jgi:murein DD-endopeptidase MepM/ murein hydrolase activator NlpD